LIKEKIVLDAKLGYS